MIYQIKEKKVGSSNIPNQISIFTSFMCQKSSILIIRG